MYIRKLVCVFALFTLFHLSFIYEKNKRDINKWDSSIYIAKVN